MSNELAEVSDRGFPRQLSLGLLLAALLITGGQTFRPASARPLDLDEHASWYLVRGRVPGSILSRCLEQSATPPLYFWLASATCRLGDVVSPGRDGEWWLRLPAWLSGLGAVFMVWHIAEWLIGRGSGGAAAILLAAHPRLFEYAIQARPYSLGMFETLVACRYLVRLRCHGWLRRDLIGFVAANVALLWTHYLFGLLLPAQFLAAPLIRGAFCRLPVRQAGREPVSCLAIAGLLLLAGFTAVPLLAAIYRMAEIRAGLEWTTAVPAWSSPAEPLGPPVAWLAAVGTGLALGLLQRFSGSREQWQNDLVRKCMVFAVITFVPAVGLWVAGRLFSPSLAQPRYVAVLIGPAMLLLCAVLKLLGDRRGLLAGTLVFCLLGGAAGRMHHGATYRPGEDAWRGAARFLNQHARAGDLVLVQTGLAEMKLQPALFGDPGFQEYTTSRLSDFYVQTDVKRLALPMIWIPGEWMQAYGRELRGACHAKQTVWIVSATDTDLVRHSRDRSADWLRSQGFRVMSVRDLGIAEVLRADCPEEE